jgi:hypothetical protein
MDVQCLKIISKVCSCQTSLFRFERTFYWFPQEFVGILKPTVEGDLHTISTAVSLRLHYILPLRCDEKYPQNMRHLCAVSKGNKTAALKSILKSGCMGLHILNFGTIHSVRSASGSSRFPQRRVASHSLNRKWC